MEKDTNDDGISLLEDTSKPDLSFDFPSDKLPAVEPPDKPMDDVEHEKAYNDMSDPHQEIEYEIVFVEADLTIPFEDIKRESWFPPGDYSSIGENRDDADGIYLSAPHYDAEDRIEKPVSARDDLPPDEQPPGEPPGKTKNASTSAQQHTEEKDWEPPAKPTTDPQAIDYDRHIPLTSKVGNPGERPAFTRDDELPPDEPPGKTWEHMTSRLLIREMMTTNSSR